MHLTKQQCRTHFLARRSLLQPADIQNLSGLIAGKVAELLRDYSLRIVHTFIGHVDRKEVDTTLIREIIGSDVSTLAQGIYWVAPRITPSTFRMEHYIWRGDTPLVANRWGILEPDHVRSEAVDTEKIEAVLLPLLAYDRQGHRVGYGGGYYDRFLADCRPDVLKIGLSFFDPIDRITDVSPHDVRLNYCISPSNIHGWKV
jgi:5-formyltetrahydrofolate cyclo-ligase